jgi:uncharacterized protein with GYD domain
MADPHKFAGEKVNHYKCFSLNKGGILMPIFMMFGKYNHDSIKGVSPERTKKAVEIIGQNGGKVISMFAVVGEHDLVFTLDFPTTEQALAASVALHMLTGISFTTSPVVDVEQFDRMISEIKNM